MTDARSFLDLLDMQAAKTPDAPALGFPSGSSTYAELAASVERSARRLAAAGVTPGDRVAILLREAAEPYVSVGLGAMRLGAIVVPVNARNKTHELAYVLGHAEPRVLVTSEDFSALVEEAGPPAGCRVVMLDAMGELGEAPGDVDARAGGEDPALLLYTSGTTADPKGCMLSHRAFVAVGRNGVERLAMGPDDRMWTPLAFFHVGGWQVLATCFTAGAATSHPGFFEPGAALDQLERERVTVAFPAFELIWLAVLDHPRFPEADLSALRIIMNVGVRERLVAMQARVPHAAQVSCFGLTESCGSICIGEAADPLESRTTTSGRPMAGVEIRLLDPDTGDESDAGELLFRSPTSFSGYYRDPGATARTIDADGWVRTGDLVRRNADGTLSYVSRLKDMLKVGGENVSAAEIEGFLLGHPAVGVAAVVGAPDARYGEVPAAFVQCTPGAEVTEQELITHCLGAIATYKVPRYVRFVDEFPVTANQKIQKVALRTQIAEELQQRGITEAPKLVTR